MRMNNQRTDRRGMKGFTLAELLIVVAIIAVLVAIAIPVFTSQLEKSREATDLANVRSAYAEVMSAAITDDENRKEADGTFSATVELRQQQDDWATEVANLSIGGIPSAEWVGKPKAGGQCTVRYIPGTDVCKIIWQGAYAGFNVTNSTQYARLTEKERIARDVLLLDSLQDVFRGMTYGEIRALFFDGNNLKSEFDGKSYSADNANPQALVGAINNKMCVTLAESTIVNGKAGDSDQYHNRILLTSVFESSGYAISGNTDENYIANSVNSDGASDNNEGKGARLWVNLGISRNDLKNLNSSSEMWNQKATSAYTYIKGAGMKTDPSVSESTRRNQ